MQFTAFNFPVISHSMGQTSYGLSPMKLNADPNAQLYSSSESIGHANLNHHSLLDPRIIPRKNSYGARVCISPKDTILNYAESDLHQTPNFLHENLFLDEHSEYLTAPSLCHAPATPPLSISDSGSLPDSRASTPALVADDDSDYGSGAESEDSYYVPSKMSHKRKRSPKNTPIFRSSSPSPSFITSPTPSKRARRQPPSRNRQSTQPAALTKAARKTSDFVCPECGWRQANKRSPDFKRHLRTHTRPSDSDRTKGWWCRGVLLFQRNQYAVAPDAESYEFLGKQRIGGCLMTFSRRDALKRHLDNHNIDCVGACTLPNAEN